MPHSPTFSPLGSCACAKSSGQSCGNCLPILPTTPRAWNHFSARCRGQPRRRLPSRDSTTRRWPGGRGQRQSAECRLRHALEVRHPSFANRDFIRLLREQDIALVVADTAGKWPFFEDATSDFVYIRLHGDTELYVSGYTPSALQSWASKIRAWAAGRTPAGSKLVTQRPSRRVEGRDVFIYFDNDAKVHAPFDAMSLARILKLDSSNAAARSS